MPVSRTNSLYKQLASKSESPLPVQVASAILTSRPPLASSPVVNALRATELKKKSNLHNLSISDCSCPICLEILIEPVVLPCKHELCLPCFKDMMDQTNFLCPMCRMRLSTWARSASKQNSLVDKERWSQIQRAFSGEIKNRLEGKTAVLLAEQIQQQKDNQSSASHIHTHHQHIVSAQGEIKKEYEDYVKREQERDRLEKEKEEQLSLQYIQEIIQREEACTVNDYLRNLIATRPHLAQNQPIAQPPQAIVAPIVEPEQPIAGVQQTTQPVEVVSTAAAATTSTTEPVTVAQPFITPSIPARRAASNRLLNRVKSTLVSNSPSAADRGTTSSTLSQQSNVINENSSTTAVSQDVTPTYSLRPRASTKRTLDDVRTLRSNLVSSLARSNQTSDESQQPRAKRSLRSSTNSSLNGSNVSNESVNSQANETIEIIDSKQPVLPQGMAQLVRRKSVRVAKK